MRTAGLLVLGTAFGFTRADVICGTKHQRTASEYPKSRVWEGTTSNSLEHFCSTSSEAEIFVTHQSGPAVFTITRIDNSRTFDVDDCKEQFNHIIKQCIVHQDLWGGTALAQGLMYEVYFNDSNDVGVEQGSLEGRKANKPEVARSRKIKTKEKKTKAKKTKAKKTKAQKAKAQKAKAEKDKAKKTKPKKSTPKACKYVPGKGRGKAKTTTKSSGGKKTIRNLIDRFIVRLVHRADGLTQDELDAEFCDKPDRSHPMEKRSGWGQTWFGFRQEPEITSGWTRNTIQDFAIQGYNEVRKQSPDVTLVAALWIPEVGVYLGSIPHGAGQEKLATDCPTSAPRLWSKLQGRKFKEGTQVRQSLYHAEDAAMFYYEEQNQSTPLEKRYPPRKAFLTTYGFRYKYESNAPKAQAPCTGETANITPDCRLTVNSMDVTTPWMLVT